MMYELRINADNRVVGYRGVGIVSRQDSEDMIRSLFKSLSNVIRLRLYLDLASVTEYHYSFRWIFKIYSILYPSRLNKISKVAVLTNMKDPEDLPLDGLDIGSVNLFSSEERSECLREIIT